MITQVGYSMAGRSKGEASWARIFYSALKTGRGATTGGIRDIITEVTSSRS
jgi:hypothetical protein